MTQPEHLPKLAPFRFTILSPAAAPITLPPPLPSPPLTLLSVMRSDEGRHTARRWASLAGIRLSVAEAQLERMRGEGLVTCSAQLWEVA